MKKMERKEHKVERERERDGSFSINYMNSSQIFCTRDNTLYAYFSL